MYSQCHVQAPWSTTMVLGYGVVRLYLPRGHRDVSSSRRPGWFQVLVGVDTTFLKGGRGPLEQLCGRRMKGVTAAETTAAPITAATASTAALAQGQGQAQTSPPTGDNNDAWIAPTMSEDPTTTNRRRRSRSSAANHNNKKKKRRRTTPGGTTSAADAATATIIAATTTTFLGTGYADLMVQWPAAKDRPKLLVRALLERLESSGCTLVALAHTVYGAPPPPSSSDKRRNGTTNDDDAFPDDVKTLFRGKGTMRVVRRLHAVVESLSDVGLYSRPSSTASSLVASSSSSPVLPPHNTAPRPVLRSYDVVSLAPRTEAAFRACCASATAASIITLDYHSPGGGSSHRLPYRIRSEDVEAAVQRGATFEVLYAPAILNSGAIRRSFVQTFRAVHDAGRASKPRILLSSGYRHKYNGGGSSGGEASDSDVGTLALRRPGDLINLLECVCHLPKAKAVAAVSASQARTALFAAAPQKRTAIGVSVVAAVSVNDDYGEAVEDGGGGALTEPPTVESALRPEIGGSKHRAHVQSSAPPSHDDGYIAL